MKTIGITAVTQKSGIECFQYITRESKKRYQGKHPRIILECTSIHEYVRVIENGDKKGLIALLLDSLNALHGAGATVAIIPNNSSLGVFDELKNQSPIELISLSEAVKDECVANKFHSICLLGPSPVINNRSYQKILEDLKLTTVVLDPVAQEFVHNEIMAATKKGEEIGFEAQLKIRQLLAEKGKLQKFDAIIVACSELLNILPKDGPAKIINPFEVLAEKVLGKAL